MIKGYTDLEQSKKLTEILPLESADMFCADVLDMDRTHSYNFHILSTWGCNTFEELKDRENKFVCFTPCWSLAALLDLLPPYLYEFDRGIDLNIYRNLNGKGWHCSYMPNCIENMKKDKFKLITNGDNLVDACYKMIVELKERNLI